MIELLTSLGISYYNYYIRSTEAIRYHELRLLSRKEMKIVLRNMTTRTAHLDWENFIITWEEAVRV